MLAFILIVVGVATVAALWDVWRERDVRRVTRDALIGAVLGAGVAVAVESALNPTTESPQGSALTPRERPTRPSAASVALSREVVQDSAFAEIRAYAEGCVEERPSRFFSHVLREHTIECAFRLESLRPDDEVLDIAIESPDDIVIWDDGGMRHQGTLLPEPDTWLTGTETYGVVRGVHTRVMVGFHPKTEIRSLPMVEISALAGTRDRGFRRDATRIHLVFRDLKFETR